MSTKVPRLYDTLEKQDEIVERPMIREAFAPQLPEALPAALSTVSASWIRYTGISSVSSAEYTTSAIGPTGAIDALLAVVQAQQKRDRAQSRKIQKEREARRVKMPQKLKRFL